MIDLVLLRDFVSWWHYFFATKAPGH